MVASCTWEKRPSMMQPRNSQTVRRLGGWAVSVSAARLTAQPPNRLTGFVAASIHRKADPAPPGEPSRQSRSAEQSREPVDDRRHARACQRRERQAGEGLYAPLPVLSEQRARRLEPAPVTHTGRAHGLAAAAAEAAVEVEGDAGVVGRELARLEGAHQLDPTPRAVGLVAGGEERGAGLEAEAAVDARVERREPSPIRHSVPSTATTKASPGSNVRRRPAIRGPAPHVRSRRGLRG